MLVAAGAAKDDLFQALVCDCEVHFGLTFQGYILKFFANILDRSHIKPVIGFLLSDNTAG